MREWFNASAALRGSPLISVLVLILVLLIFFVLFRMRASRQPWRSKRWLRKGFRGFCALNCRPSCKPPWGRLHGTRTSMAYSYTHTCSIQTYRHHHLAVIPKRTTVYMHASCGWAIRYSLFLLFGPVFSSCYNYCRNRCSVLTPQQFSAPLSVIPCARLYFPIFVRCPAQPPLVDCGGSSSEI